MSDKAAAWRRRRARWQFAERVTHLTLKDDVLGATSAVEKGAQKLFGAELTRGS